MKREKEKECRAKKIFHAISKKRYEVKFLVIILHIVVICVLIRAGYAGWRIVYAPELEPDWESISAVGSAVGALGTLLAVWYAVLSTNQQNEMSKQQQRQETGLNLYPERRKALRLFAEKKYDEMYWDAVILFSPEIAEKILDIGFCKNTHKEYCDLIEQYEMEMHSSVPTLYKEYHRLKYKEDTDVCEEILHLCDQFSPIVTIPWTGEKRLLNYRELYKGEIKARKKGEKLHLETFEMMKDEIRESIQQRL